MDGSRLGQAAGVAPRRAKTQRRKGIYAFFENGGKAERPWEEDRAGAYPESVDQAVRAPGPPSAGAGQGLLFSPWQGAGRVWTKG